MDIWLGYLEMQFPDNCLNEIQKQRLQFCLICKVFFFFFFLISLDTITQANEVLIGEQFNPIYQNCKLFVLAKLVVGTVFFFRTLSNI